MNFFLDKNTITNQISILLHKLLVADSAVVCLSWKSRGNLAGIPVFINEDISKQICVFRSSMKLGPGRTDTTGAIQQQVQLWSVATHWQRVCWVMETTKLWYDRIVLLQPWHVIFYKDNEGLNGQFIQWTIEVTNALWQWVSMPLWWQGEGRGAPVHIISVAGKYNSQTLLQRSVAYYSICLLINILFPTWSWWKSRLSCPCYRYRWKKKAIHGSREKQRFSE